MQRVLRWDVPVDDDWHEIGGGRVVHVAARAHRKRPGDLVEVWTLEGAHPPGTTEPGKRSVIVIGTGQPAPARTHYVGTAVVPSFVTDSPGAFPGAYVSVASVAGLVWHVFSADGVMP